MTAAVHGTQAALFGTLFGLTGKVALVTGGTSGIGLAMATALVGAGARTYIVARSEDDGVRIAAELSQQGGDCRFVRGDLTSQAGIRSVAAALADRETSLDILVNNAGSVEVAPIDDYDEEIWDRALNINLKAAFFLTRALLPLLRKGASRDDPSRVVNIGSGHGLRASDFDHFGYSAAKAGIHHLTRVLARKLSGDCITVNAIAPGAFASRQTHDFPADQVKRIVAAIPCGRFGEAEDAMGAVLYFCTRAGGYTTGVVLPVDGGRGLT